MITKPQRRQPDQTHLKLLQMSSDVHPNPCPATKYPCPVCTRNTTLHSQLCRVIQNLLSDRRLYVELNNERSRWRIQKNGLPQGSVLSPTLFNIYTIDQTILDGTRSFIYARRPVRHSPVPYLPGSNDLSLHEVELSGNYRYQQIEINSYPDSPLFILTGFLPRVSSMRMN